MSAFLKAGKPLAQMGMIGGNPSLYHSVKFTGALQQFCGLGRGGNLDPRVIDDVALAAALIEEQQEMVRLGPKCQACALERQCVMTGHGGHPIALAGRGHACGLKRGVVCGRETAVFRKSGQSGVGEVSGDHRAKFIEFLLACVVGVNLPRREQSIPAHFPSL